MVLGITPYLRFSMTLSAVTSVVRLAKSKVISYLAVFLIIMYGFGTAGFIIYGDKIPAFSSIFRGSLEMILATLGGIQYAEMKAINSWITPLFGFSYLIFANTVFLKTFLLIIQEEYNDYFAAYSKVDLLEKTGSDLVTMIIHGCDLYTKEVEMAINKINKKQLQLQERMTLKLNQGGKKGKKKDRKKEIDPSGEVEIQKEKSESIFYLRSYLYYLKVRKAMLVLSQIILKKILDSVKAGSQFEAKLDLKKDTIQILENYPYVGLDKKISTDSELEEDRYDTLKSFKMIISNFEAGHINLTALNSHNPSVWMSELNKVIDHDSHLKVGLEFESEVNHYNNYQELMLFNHREQVSIAEIAAKLKWRRDANAEKIAEYVNPEKFKSLEKLDLSWEDHPIDSDQKRAKMLINLYLYLSFVKILAKKEMTAMNENELNLTTSSRDNMRQASLRKVRAAHQKRSVINDINSVKDIIVFENTVLNCMNEKDYHGLRRLWYSFSKELRAKLWLEPTKRMFSDLKRFAVMYAVGRSL